MNTRNISLVFLTCCVLAAPQSRADGIYRDGVGARAMGMGGADVAYAIDPLGAMGANPAALGFLATPGMDLGVDGASADGRFTKSPTSSGSLDSSPQAFGEGAIAAPVGPKGMALGLSIIPTALLSANWQYADPLGAYSSQENKSEILVLRSAAGIGYSWNDHWSAGMSVGLLYNQNQLIAPYVFQSQPVLKGAQVLLHLKTDGFGADGQFGLAYKVNDKLRFGLTYNTPSSVDSHGHASGNASPAGALPFQYAAEVKNTFPQTVIIGTSWNFHPHWRLALQLDWVDWGDSFKTLPVLLSSGSSTAINGLVGGNSMQDNIPLNWSDEFVYRVGLEYDLNRDWALRLGYAYGGDPVPSATLTPLTAVIMENILTAGVGYHWRNFQFDLAYQWDIPAQRSVGVSGLAGGQYSFSTTSVSLHWLALTTGFTF